MFGINLRVLRFFMAGVFAIASIICICLVPGIILFMIRRNLFALFPLRGLLFGSIFPIQAIIYGVSWWKIWKEKPSTKVWGVTASILQMMFPIWQIIFRHKSIWNCHGEVLAIGTFGLIVFLWPYNKDSYTDDYETSEAETDDIEQEDNPS